MNECVFQNSKVQDEQTDHPSHALCYHKRATSSHKAIKKGLSDILLINKEPSQKYNTINISQKWRLASLILVTQKEHLHIHMA